MKIRRARVEGQAARFVSQWAIIQIIFARRVESAMGTCHRLNT